MKEAENHIGKRQRQFVPLFLDLLILIASTDNITASSFQMKEVLEGYRVSSDLASRNRVREAMNAALQSLPEWPPQNW